MDVEVVANLKKNTSVKPCGQPDHLEEMRQWFIQKESWGIMYKVHEDHIVTNCMMFLQDKNCYKSATLTGILTKAEI